MSRTQKIIGSAVVLILVVGGGLAWWLGFLTDPPEEANIAAATEAVAAGSDGAPADSAPLDNIDGSWSVVANEDGTFVGYRINEVLSTIGDFTVVARTREVTGTLEAQGTTITAVSISAQMTTITTDNGARDNAMRSQALETDLFPEATFVLTAPIDIGAIPAEGETVSVTANGDLTVHGVTKAVQFPIQASVAAGSLVVVGQLDVALADFDITPPSAPIVSSVEDVAILEMSLVFSR